MKNHPQHLATNIQKLRLRRRLNQVELAEKLGITRKKLSAIESGQTINPPVADLINISTFFRVSIDTLLKNDLQTTSEQELAALEEGNDYYITGTKIRVLATTVDSDNNENAELVPEKARAGYRRGYGDPAYIAELPRYALPGLSKHCKYRIFPIVGDSMLPYPDGSYIVGEYVEDWLSLKQDSLCVLILKTGGTEFVFKKVENRIRTDRVFLAKSLNPLYDPYEIQVNDIIEIWKYKAVYTEHLLSLAPELSTDSLFQMMQDVKWGVEKINEAISPRRRPSKSML